jgi:hypothetical protein
MCITGTCPPEMDWTAVMVKLEPAWSPEPQLVRQFTRSANTSPFLRT